MTIPLVDLVAQYNSLKKEIDKAIEKVIQSGQFIGGSEVEQFESDMATYCDMKYAIGVASGTDALRLALRACGVTSGNEVITTPFTFIATAEAIIQCGAIIVFNDIEPETYNLDPDKIEVTSKTKAIIPVHLYGQPVDMSPILEYAQRYDIKVIEDCAQAIGAKYKGKRVGGLGDAGCLSFFPSKTLGAYGDGGMVVTNNPDIAEEVRMLRNHGYKEKYFYETHGFNSRLDSIQAAILRVKFRHLDKWIKMRHEKASLYTKLLKKIDGIKTPYTNHSNYSTFNYYTIRVDKRLGRGKLADFLKSYGINVAVYYPLSLHLQKVYEPLGYKIGDFPESEYAQEEVLSLPIYPELENQQIEWIVNQIREFSINA